MKIFVYLAVVLPCVLGSRIIDLTEARTLQTRLDKGVSAERVFEYFKQTFNKVYGDEKEENMRRAIFKENANYIKTHNQLYAKGKVSFFLGVNQFADLTNLEFKKLYTGHLSKRPASTNASTFLPPANLVLPATVDWRTQGYVTAVKNQGQCGSCWAFSTTGSLEGQHFKKTGKLISMSEQQLVDCSGDYGNNGCEGGLMDDAFQYIKAMGEESETAYPYTAQDDTCKYQKSKVVATDTGYVDVESESESALHKAVATVGPISVAIDASHSSFQLYSGGVYYEPDCSSTELDHGVLAVGYGTSGSNNYWLVKNSWGESWGTQGYIQMSRNKDNNCGIATQASYPLV